MKLLNTHPSVNDPAVLHGDGTYGFTARIEGDDLVVRGARATWFGGVDDPLDSGETASGVSTRLHPELIGCALPMNGFRVTGGSPLPRLPWMTTVVEVTRVAGGQSVKVRLIDLGPAAPPRAHAAIDLTRAAFRALGGELAQGSMTVDFRVPGGALRLPRAILLAARSAAPSADPIQRAAQAQARPAAAAASTDGFRSSAPALRPVKTAAGAAGAPNPADAPTLEGHPGPGGTAAGSTSLAVPSAGEGREKDEG